MANLDRIQQRLNTDAAYRASFLRDPVAALAQEGLQLPFDVQNKVRAVVARISQRGPGVPGAARGHAAEKIELPLYFPMHSL